MSSNSVSKSVLLVGLLTGAFLVSSASFAAPTPGTPPSTAKTMPAPATTTTASTTKVNESCKKQHDDVNSKAYKDCVKEADKVKMK